MEWAKKPTPFLYDFMGRTKSHLVASDNRLPNAYRTASKWLHWQYNTQQAKRQHVRNMYGEKFSDVFRKSVGLHFSRNNRDSEYIELAKDPEKNRGRLRKMVEDAAKEAIALENSGEIGAYYEKRSIAPARCRGTIPRTASAVKCS